MSYHLVPFMNKLHREYSSKDLVDWLNYSVTATVIASCAMLLGATQLVGTPIKCWVPNEFTMLWSDFTDSICYADGSYFLPMNVTPGDDGYLEKKRDITYYQWVPIVLAIQAFCFYFPCLFWKALNMSSGLNLQDILENAARIKKDYTLETKNQKVKSMSVHIKQALAVQNGVKPGRLFSGMRMSGHYLSILYLISKLLYIGNIVLQFYVLKNFLGMKDYGWGFQVFSDIYNGIPADETGNFPRVTLCEFQINVVGNIETHVVQCLLMINAFSEKIFLCFFFWLIVDFGFCVVSFFYWAVAIISSSSQHNFIEKYLLVSEIIKNDSPANEKNLVKKFVKSFLKTDGVFVLRLVKMNASYVLTTDVIEELFKEYKQKVN